MSGWSNYFEDVLEKAPMPVKHVSVLCNIQPNEEGEWIWHLSMVKGVNHEDQLTKMTEMIQTVGEGDINSYEGGVLRVLIHVIRKLSNGEIDKLPDEATSIAKQIHAFNSKNRVQS